MPVTRSKLALALLQAVASIYTTVFQGKASDKVILFYGLSAGIFFFFVLVSLSIEHKFPQLADIAALVNIWYAIIVVSGTIAFSEREILPLWP